MVWGRIIERGGGKMKSGEKINKMNTNRGGD